MEGRADENSCGFTASISEVAATETVLGQVSRRGCVFKLGVRPLGRRETHKNPLVGGLNVHLFKLPSYDTKAFVLEIGPWEVQLSLCMFIMDASGRACTWCAIGPGA